MILIRPFISVHSLLVIIRLARFRLQDPKFVVNHPENLFHGRGLDRTGAGGVLRSRCSGPAPGPCLTPGGTRGGGGLDHLLPFPLWLAAKGILCAWRPLEIPIPSRPLGPVPAAFRAVASEAETGSRRDLASLMRHSCSRDLASSQVCTTSGVGFLVTCTEELESNPRQHLNKFIFSLQRCVRIS